MLFLIFAFDTYAQSVGEPINEGEVARYLCDIQDSLVAESSVAEVAYIFFSNRMWSTRQLGDVVYHRSI